jgi:hypothetical protein
MTAATDATIEHLLEVVFSVPSAAAAAGIKVVFCAIHLKAIFREPTGQVSRSGDGS